MVFNVTLTCTFSWLKSFTLCTSSSCTRSSSDVVAGWHLMFDSSCHWNPQIEWLDVQSGAVSSDLFNIRLPVSKFHFWGISLKTPDYSTNKSLKRYVCPVINVSYTIYFERSFGSLQKSWKTSEILIFQGSHLGFCHPFWYPKTLKRHVAHLNGLKRKILMH